MSLSTLPTTSPTTLFETLVVDQEFVTLDLALWRRFRTEAAGRVERHIGLNPHVCDHIFLPVGTILTIELPRASPAAIPVISLWA